MSTSGEIAKLNLAELAEFFSGRPTDVPLICSDISLSRSDAVLTFRVLPWWSAADSSRENVSGDRQNIDSQNSEHQSGDRKSSDQSQPKLVSLVINCRGLSELQLSNPIGAASSLSVSTTHPLLADVNSWLAIFGQAPLPDPYRFLLEFYQLVQDRLSLAVNPVDYLNFQDSINKWLNVVYSRSYMLLAAPAAVVEGVRPILDAQLAEYIVLAHKPPELKSPPSNRLQSSLSSADGTLCQQSFKRAVVVQFGRSFLIAENILVDVSEQS
jgi:hypothetical protein